MRRRSCVALAGLYSPIGVRSGGRRRSQSRVPHGIGTCSWTSGSRVSGMRLDSSASLARVSAAASFISRLISRPRPGARGRCQGSRYVVPLVPSAANAAPASIASLGSISGWVGEGQYPLTLANHPGFMRRAPRSSPPPRPPPA